MSLLPSQSYSTEKQTPSLALCLCDLAPSISSLTSSPPLSPLLTQLLPEDTSTQQTKLLGRLLCCRCPIATLSPGYLQG